MIVVFDEPVWALVHLWELGLRVVKTEGLCITRDMVLHTAPTREALLAALPRVLRSLDEATAYVAEVEPVVDGRQLVYAVRFLQAVRDLDVEDLVDARRAR